MAPQAIARSLLLLMTVTVCACALGCEAPTGPTLGELVTDPGRHLERSLSVQLAPVPSTACYLTAEGVVTTRPEAALWLCICGVDPSRVTQGLLLCTRQLEPLQTLRGSSAASQAVRGVLHAFPRTDIEALLRETSGVDLVASADGRPLYLELTTPLETAPPPSGGPGLLQVPPALRSRLRAGTVPAQPSSAPSSTSSPSGGLR